MPKEDDKKKARKFPYNACELICSGNKEILKLFFQFHDIVIEDDSDEESEESEESEKSKDEENKEESDKEKDNDDDDDAPKEEKEEKEDEKEHKEEEKEEDEKEHKEHKDEDKEDKENEKEVNAIKEETKEEPQTEEQTKEETKIDNNTQQLQQQETNITNESTNDQIPSEKHPDPEHSSNDDKDSNAKQPEEEESDSDSDSDSNSSSSKPKATKTRPKYPILEYFFDFLQSPKTPSNTNDVLSGYFYKILNHLLQKQGDSLLTFLFSPYSSKYLKNLIQNLTNRTAADTMKSILTFSFSKHPELLPHRQTLCALLLDELFQTNDLIHFQCIIDSFVNSLKDKSFFLFFMSEQHLLTTLFSYKLDKDKPRYIKSYINLIRKLYNTTLQHFPNRITANNEYEPIREMTNFMDYMFSHFADEKPSMDNKDGPKCNDTVLEAMLSFIFNNLIESKCALLEGFCDFDNVEEMQATYLQQQPKLGMDKLVQAEYLYTVLDLIVNATYMNVHKDLIAKLAEVLKEKKLLWNIHNIFFLFEFNNIYHNIYSNIFAVVLNQHTPKEVIDAFFVCDEEQTDLLSLYIDSFVSKYIFKFESERSITSCCFAFEMKLLKDVMDSRNEHVKSFVQRHPLIAGFVQLVASDLNELYAQKFLLRENDAFQQEFGNFDEEKKMEFTKRNIYQLLEDNVKLFKTYKEKGNIEECLEIKEKTKKEEEEEERKQKEEKLASSIVLGENYAEDGNDNEENKGNDLFPVFGEEGEHEDNTKEDEQDSAGKNFLKSSANFGLMDDFMGIGKEENNDNGNNGISEVPGSMEFPHAVSEEIVLNKESEGEENKKEDMPISQANEEVSDEKKEEVVAEEIVKEEVVEEKKEEVAEEKNSEKKEEVAIEDKKEEAVEEIVKEEVIVEEKKEEVVIEDKKEEVVDNKEEEIVAEKKEEVIEEKKEEVIENKQPEVTDKKEEVIEEQKPEAVEEKKEE